MAHWIADADALSAFVARLAPRETIGLDTEFMRVRTYWPELALVQAADGTAAGLIDPLALPGLDGIGALLVDPSRRLVMHSASEDLIALKPWCTGPIAGLYDTQVAAAFAGLGPGMGYQRLVAALLGVELAKSETRSDWMRRPLSDEQLAYAAADVEHLEAVAAALDARLATRGFAAWCAAECRRIAEAAHRAEGDANPHWDFKSLWKWAPDRQARLKLIVDWREATAQTINKPRLWVFDNQAAVSMIENPPASAAELGTRLSAQRGFPRREIGNLYDLLSGPVDDVVATLAPIPPPLRDDDERRFESMRAAVQARATELDLPPALLAPRRVLEQLARGADPAMLEPWRREALAGCFD
jgi:ribonuclease D